MTCLTRVFVSLLVLCAATPALAQGNLSGVWNKRLVVNTAASAEPILSHQFSTANVQSPKNHCRPGLSHQTW